MRIKKKITIIATFFSLAFVLFSVLFEPFTIRTSAFAEEVSYDKTYVMDDLEGSTIVGKPFDVEDYPFDEKQSLSVLYFSEYCYSFYSERQSNFGLYLYVWNPQGLKFDTGSGQNTVELGYGEENKKEYDKYPLQFLSKSVEVNNAGLFYKFKIDLTPEQKVEMLDSLKSNGRTYHIVGCELLTEGSFNPVDYPVNQIFTYSGFSKGYGPSEDADSLVYTSRFGLALDIERQGGLRQTFYRPAHSNGANEYTQDTLQTVYFSVPKKYFNDGYDIGSIRMEWLKTLTNWIFITGNESVYNALLPWVGVSCPGYWEKAMGNVLYQYKNKNGQPLPTEYGFSSALASFNGLRDNDMSLLPILFPSNNWKTDSADDYILPFESIREYMRNYNNLYNSNKTFYDGEFDPPHVMGQPYEKGGNFIFKTPYGGESVKVEGVDYQYNRALFTYVDKKKTKIDISAENTRSLRDVEIGRKWWDGLFGLDGEYKVSSEEYDGIEAIHSVTEKDLLGSNEEISRRLYVNKNDCNDFKTFYDEATERKEVVVLVRYDVGIYQAAEGKEGIYKNSSLVTGWTNGDTNCRVSRMNYYLNLDVIHLKFDNGEEEFYLPVISSPIDAGSDATPALKTTSDKPHLKWWQIVLGVVALAVIAILLIKYAPWLFTGLFNVIAAPFKVLSKACKSGRERRREKRKDKKQERKNKKEAKKQRRESERFDREWEESLLDEIDWDDPFWSDLDDFNG